MMLLFIGHQNITKMDKLWFSVFLIHVVAIIKLHTKNRWGGVQENKCYCGDGLVAIFMIIMMIIQILGNSLEENY